MAVHSAPLRILEYVPCMVATCGAQMQAQALSLPRHRVGGTTPLDKLRRAAAQFLSTKSVFLNLFALLWHLTPGDTSLWPGAWILLLLLAPFNCTQPLCF